MTTFARPLIAIDAQTDLSAAELRVAFPLHEAEGRDRFQSMLTTVSRSLDMWARLTSCSTDWPIAVHEAAHCVAGYLRLDELDSVSIVSVRGEGSGGRFRYSHGPLDEQAERIMGVVAGPISEMELAGATRLRLTGTDRDRVETYLASVDGRFTFAAGYRASPAFGPILDSARAFVRQHRSTIELLAVMLCEFRFLTASQIETVLSQKIGDRT